MRTISIAELKAHLSAELKKVQAGDPVTVLDHKRPVAILGPLVTPPESKPRRVLTIFKPATGPLPDMSNWKPLIEHDALTGLLEDREDRW